MVAITYKIALLLIIVFVISLADSPFIEQKKHIVEGDTLYISDPDELQNSVDEVYIRLKKIQGFVDVLYGLIDKLEKDIKRIKIKAFEIGSHTHDASDIISGILDTARYHAYDDLVVENKIGSGSGQIVGGPEFIDSVTALKTMVSDSTSQLRTEMRDTATVVWNDSASVMRTYVQTIVEDSLDEYSTTTAIQALIADSLDEYSLTTWIQGQINDLNDRIDSVIANCCPSRR